MISRHLLIGKVIIYFLTKGLGLTDYTFIIKTPMDLGSINNKLRDDKYRFVEEYLDDVQLVWDNCKAYNAPGTVNYNLYKTLVDI